MSIISSIVIGLITSAFTVWLSFRRFRSEKLWEKKIESYTRIIEALYELKKELGGRMESHYQEIDEDSSGYGNVMPMKGGAYLYDEELKKYRDIGALIISKRAVDLIDKYHSELSTDEYDDESRYSMDIRAADKCLEAILSEAKKDLR